MSLIDLKKSNKTRGNKKPLTVDEFIADAENYAAGKPELAHSDMEHPLSQESMVSQNRVTEQTSRGKPFRHATFTLSEQAIEQLQLLASESKLAKSHIIRILINQACKKDQKEGGNTQFSSWVD